MADEVFDQTRVMSEIHEEALRLRRDGIVTPEFERSLDEIFDQLAPPSGSHDLDDLVTSAEELAFINVDAPPASNIPGGRAVKSLVSKSIRWYVNYLSVQTQEFAVVAARTLRLTGERISRIEDTIPALAAGAQRESLKVPNVADPMRHAAAVAEALAAIEGRVLHADCGSGDLIRAVSRPGVDAYGIDPHLTPTAIASTGDLELRSGDALEHARRVSSGMIGGLILSGCVDRYPLAWKLALLDEATRIMAPHGAAVIITADGDDWRQHHVASDLSPGEPLHPDTWCHLMESRGFRDVRSVPDEGQDVRSVCIVGLRGS